MASTTQKWVIGGVVVVGILLLLSERSAQNPSGGTGLIGGGGSCTVTVIDDAPIRSRAEGDAPVVGTLNRGTAVLAERTVSNGYRQLGLSLWVARESLEPTPGSDCG